MERIDLDHVSAPVSEMEMRNLENLRKYAEHPLRHEVQHRWFNRPIEERQQIERQFKGFGDRPRPDPMRGYVRRRSPRDDFPPSAA